MAGLRETAVSLAAKIDEDVWEEAAIGAVPMAAQAAGRVDANGLGIERPWAKDYDAIAHRVVARLAGGQPLSRADLRDAAWCLWTTQPALAENDTALAAYLRRVSIMDRIRPYRTLASSYILHFRLDRPHLALIGRVLAAHAVKAGLPWSAAHAAFAIFDPDEVFKRLADVAMVPFVRPAKQLQSVRIGSLPQGTGLEVALHARALSALKTLPNTDPLERLRTVIAWAGDTTGALVDVSLAALVGEALLVPFRGQTPDREIRDRYVEAMFRLLGDPRFEPLKWADYPAGEAIVRRWLSEQSLRMFFDGVARVQPPEFWQHRRAFWEAVYRASLVDEAWVVFDSEGAVAARKLFGDHAAFAHFMTGAPSSEIPRGAAVLMLKLGTLVVADWSHGGPCLIWDLDQDSAVPAFFRKAYEPGRFRKITVGPESIESHAAQGIFWHSGTEAYVWQDQIADYLLTRRAMKLPRASYRV